MKNLFSLPAKEFEILKKINTPVRVQNFLDTLKINFEPNGDTFFSPMTVLQKKACHCIEGAILAALALRLHGQAPLLVDLTANKNDFDHVITVFKKDGFWGAISKTNHAALRYREPVYRSIRELAMSYFHEYFDDFGRKNLRSYSSPVNLKRFDRRGWMTTFDNVYYIPEYLVAARHFPLLTKKQFKNLREADPIEIEAGKITEWKAGEKQNQCR